ncbi:hypothetical protein PIB30_044037 [Stylosanthes scabra]|uniref:Desiccation-related protein PCC13-62 n=1 Tax=Stylosanthes scabra TaxID=79078 RepID=A0ABU6QF51_9FABA|nr:hypothetical protein [Stylosanthes scabra]
MVSFQVMLSFLVLPILVARSYPCNLIDSLSPISDVELLEFSLNLEYLEAGFFWNGATGGGIDDVDPELAQGGPPPSHWRTIEGFPRPILNISKEVFAEVMDSAFGKSLQPPFDPYVSTINFLLASYVIPFVGFNGFVGANPEFKMLVVGLLGIEACQHTFIQAKLYNWGSLQVHPYGVTVATFMDHISSLRNKLGNEGPRDDNLVDIIFGSVLAVERTPQEILRIVYDGGDEYVSGGFFSRGADGRIAKSYLKRSFM